MSRHSILWAALLALGATAALRAQAPFPPDGATKVQAMLAHHCSECHGGALAQPKGEFGGIEDLTIVVEDYVDAGQPAESSLWTWMNEAGEDRMPPPKAKNGPLTTEQLALVHWWISAGAPLPEPGAAPAPAPTIAADERAGIVRFLGRLHVLLVHFPIALLLVAFIAEICGRTAAARLCLLVGALAAVFASTTGLISADRPGDFGDLIDRHKFTGIATTGVALVALFVNERRLRRGARRGAALALMAATAILVALAGHWGGALVFGEGFPF